MKPNHLTFICSLILMFGCSEISKEKRPLVKDINVKVRHIDGNHRVQILEDDFHKGDSIFKIRGFYMEKELIKLVGVLYTSHVERDDYFYFEEDKLIFSGHVVVSRDNRMASEYKYYWQDEKLAEALYWEDMYRLGRQFPHEHFIEFEPNMDSLQQAEEKRLSFFKEKLATEGVEILHENENRDANTIN